MRLDISLAIVFWYWSCIISLSLDICLEKIYLASAELGLCLAELRLALTLPKITSV